MPRSLYERMIDKTIPVPESGCIIFLGSVDGGGYGQVSTKRGKAPAKSHRISWENENGEIPEGMMVCHKCDTPRCVNPDHLFLGSQFENMRDMSSKGRMNKNSIENLRPGKLGVRGAGPLSNKEIRNG